MSRPDDQYWIHRWNDISWMLLGLAPTFIAGLGDQGAVRYWSLGLPLALAVAYAVVVRFPGRPQFLYVLIAALGALSYLRTGGAALFIVSIPHFWILAGSPRRSIMLSGAAALCTAAGGILRNGDFLNGNVIVTLVAFVASVLLGLSMLKIIRRSEERATRLSAELETTQRELLEAHERQGAVLERERLAREIHDTLAQGFASIVVLAEAARSATDPELTTRQLLSIEQTARENLAEARVLVGSAPQSGIAPSSIARTLRRTLDRFAEDTNLTVIADLPDIECDQQTRIALLRCTQESLANVRKHAAATTIGVVLTRHPYAIELEITDDGRGFIVADSQGFGLDGMRKRLAELGGELTVTSSPGDGTRVLAMIPNGAP
ncbi:sensor histidine kinase [Actinomadura rudentiformis]|uniref:Sensor histidine kinase n=1 Tax=Actinomadura rudentiformis TaxID=359158 RepID=A0A6H9YRU5_9ACTN|nr:sensor histidine kinase [Actinomadura rudentiformis]KAB2342153.1 sensor histidine kinase [Actinomadura rudentiformis]